MKYVAASIFLLIISYLNIYKPLYKYFDYFFSPLQFGLNATAVNIKEFTAFYSNLKSVRRENIKLLEDNLILESRIAELKHLKEENNILRDQLNVTSTLFSDKKQLLVSVMGNPTDLSSSTVIVDKGSAHGVSIGDNVVIGYYVLGRVVDVSAVKSKVQLITSPDISITAYNIDSQDKTEGIVIGKHGSSVSVGKILPSERLQVGDMFVTSGKDGLFFPGLYIGKVTKVVEEPAQPLKSADLQTIIDVKRIDEAFILTTQ